MVKMFFSTDSFWFFLMENHRMKVIAGFKGNALSANGLLVLVSGTLFYVLAVGQFIFAYYTLVFYGRSSIEGHFEKWNKVMPTGLINGDMVGNLILAIHLFLAVVITVGGPVQLMPWVRNNFRTFHRGLGRIYIITAFIASISGLYMIATRDTLGGIPLKLANTLDAILIMLFAFLALRTARQRKFALHRKWTLRLFVVVSGVWFIRIWYGFCRLVFEGKIPGSAPNLEGITNILIGFGSYLLPLFLLELFFMAQKRRDNGFSLLVFGLLLVFMVIMAMGIFSFSKVWFYRLTI